MAKAKAKFRLEGEAVFALTGKGSVNWFNLVEPDATYSKFGGKFSPEDSTKMEGIISDVLAGARAELDEADLKASQVSPIKRDDDGNIYFNIGRSATKADGSPAVIKLRNLRGKVDMDVLEHNELGNGSTVNMKVMFRSYFMPEQTTAGITIPARYGVSMMPIEVQVIKHVIYSADSDGFDDETTDTTEDDGGGFSNEGSSDDY